MKRILLIAATVLLATASLWADDTNNVITLPAAASIVGGAPFFSDVRAFNTSYTDSLDVTATYRCFIGPCPVSPAQAVFTLEPRESKPFNDMCVSAFNLPNTAGGVEFSFTGESEQLVVTSRLFSTAPVPTVGMFIPGLENSDAHTTTVLTSIRNGGSGLGFRTNVGVFNPGDVAVNVTFTIFDGGASQGVPVTRSVPGHGGVQVSGIFNVAQVPTHATDDAYIVAAATGAVFSYAAVIDNKTTDPIFVVGAQKIVRPLASMTMEEPSKRSSSLPPT